MKIIIRLILPLLCLAFLSQKFYNEKGPGMQTKNGREWEDYCIELID